MEYLLSAIATIAMFIVVPLSVTLGNCTVGKIVFAET